MIIPYLAHNSAQVTPEMVPAKVISQLALYLYNTSLHSQTRGTPALGTDTAAISLQLSVLSTFFSLTFQYLFKKGVFLKT